MKYKLRSSQGVAFYHERALKFLGFEEYDPKVDLNFPCLFSGLYGPEDYEALQAHRGRKAIFWNGSDIGLFASSPHFQLILKQYPKIKHACHTEIQKARLAEFGINAKVRPIFFGDINKYPVSYKHSENPAVYLTVNPGREKEYGMETVYRIAKRLPDFRFHIYGCDGFSHENIFFHGRVSEEQMDKEIINMQCSLRLNLFDGLSQTTIKSILMGQMAITSLEYPDVFYAKNDEEIHMFLSKLTNLFPELKNSRDHYLPLLNDFSWLEEREKDLSLVMILKNEAKGLETAILSCIDFVDEIVLSVDSKSTDDTLEIAKKYADELIVHEWMNDFSAIRNYVQKFSTCKYVLILDGHEFVRSSTGIVDALKQDVGGFEVTCIMEDGHSFHFARLLRKEIQWKSAVHNYPDIKDIPRLPDFVVVHDRDNLQASDAIEERAKQRSEMIYSILGANVKKDKNDTRSLFYLGQQSLYDHKWKDAIHWYIKYLKISKWTDERFAALFELARASAILGRRWRSLYYFFCADHEIPGRWEAQKRIGATFMDLKLYRKALPHLVNGLNKDFGDFDFHPEGRNDAHTWDLIGQCFFRLGNRNESLIAWSRSYDVETDKEKRLILENRLKTLKYIIDKK